MRGNFIERTEILFYIHTKTLCPAIVLWSVHENALKTWCSKGLDAWGERQTSEICLESDTDRSAVSLLKQKKKRPFLKF